MTCPSLNGEPLLRMLRVAEDAKISERLGILPMSAAGVLLRILQNDELLKQVRDMAWDNYTPPMRRGPSKKDSSHGDIYFMARLADEMGITSKLQITPVQALTELLDISSRDRILQIAEDRYINHNQGGTA